MRRHTATTKRRAFRSVSLPLAFRKSSIGVGSVQASHSASVMASLLAQDQVHDPTATHMLTRLAAVVQDVRIGAASFFEGVSQHGEAVRVERAGGQDAIFIGSRRECRYGRRLPSRIEGGGTEGIADNFSNEVADHRLTVSKREQRDTTEAACTCQQTEFSMAGPVL